MKLYFPNNYIWSKNPDPHITCLENNSSKQFIYDTFQNFQCTHHNLLTHFSFTLPHLYLIPSIKIKSNQPWLPIGLALFAPTVLDKTSVSSLFAMQTWIRMVKVQVVTNFQLFFGQTFSHTLIFLQNRVISIKRADTCEWA